MCVNSTHVTHSSTFTSSDTTLFSLLAPSEPFISKRMPPLTQARSRVIIRICKFTSHKIGTSLDSCKLYPVAFWSISGFDRYRVECTGTHTPPSVMTTTIWRQCIFGGKEKKSVTNMTNGRRRFSSKALWLASRSALQQEIPLCALSRVANALSKCNVGQQSTHCFAPQVSPIRRWFLVCAAAALRPSAK